MCHKEERMPSIRIPTPLRTYTGGQNEVNVGGGTVAEALTDLVRQYPALQPHLFNTEGTLRPFVNLFLGEDNVKDIEGQETSLRADDRLLLIPSIAGGS
jgi:molybdopterin converting factor small subunit